MPRSRDLLRRFRPAGTPGAAASTGVPADRVSELSAELAPILALVADDDAQADRVRAEAEQKAQRTTELAAQRARDRLTDARLRAEAERSAAAAQVGRGSAQQAERIVADARREADVVRERGRERIPDLVRRVVDDIRGGAIGGPS
ncbi:hypothetical protein [Rhodococcus sp. AG1013]|uniref:hypothetical protein n=1 Tax=unclassified Rhodococcus (in: high G+C Gram-positive bacteria) TaxID=192944 RepID=UPI000E0C311E|nr:hypothetical protein [Rhodococcus sp. AG1013]RDI23210.1 hypothetical protein DEU38_11274 [Rhodococcus sp. AG1013]